MENIKVKVKFGDRVKVSKTLTSFQSGSTKKYISHSDRAFTASYCNMEVKDSILTTINGTLGKKPWSVVYEKKQKTKC